ncbi:phospholipase A1 [Stomoxys calcitrans]|uniref:phospholipase A1 n=1 Tax=Stomoxys calcitrans TaxID=35570 RepID=UPI0027E38E36|nr:phospholipase A1 [Stomoxys calcitrans]
MMWFTLIFIFGVTVLINNSEAKSVPPPAGNETASQVQNKDFSLGSCIWAISRTCPDKDVSFHLYTRQNPQTAQLVYIAGDSQASNLSQSFYDSQYSSKIIIHGYNANMFLHSLALMKDEYLAKDDYNIFYVDWSNLALGPCYLNAVYNIQHAGACVAQLVERIRDLNSSDIHLIGFSLGAHMTNYVAKNLDNFTLPRITGLDPALPLFVTSDNGEKLDESDANFVDVIHTNGLVQGKLERCGHADFYMNGGIIQPHCFKDNPINPFPCFHHRALDYYHESIRSTSGFWGWKCSSYLAYILGYCPRTNDDLFEAGENVKTTTRGMFLVDTNGKPPYAMGKCSTKDESSKNISQLETNKTINEAYMPPTKRIDRLLAAGDQWDKINYSFNNPHNHTSTPNSKGV